MHVAISHHSAFKFLDMCARNQPLPEYRFILKSYDGPNPDQLAHSRGELAGFSLDRFVNDNGIVDIFVPNHSLQRTLKGFRHHAFGGELPEGSFIDAGHGVLVCSAPLLFVQLCRGQPIQRCIRIGSNLCGLYSLEPTSKSGVVERKQLTTTKELEEFLKKAHHLRGARNAADALPWVLDRARSPQEIDLALTFCLPKRLGGHGFKKPQLNHPISITGAARKINSDHTDEIDVYWEDQHFGFEYNSYSDHGDPRKIGKDERRALSLHAIGEHVRFVTDEQLKDPHQVAMLAHILEEYGVPHVC